MRITNADISSVIGDFIPETADKFSVTPGPRNREENMSQLLESLPPRSFVDFTLPERSDGTELSMCREAGDFQTYVAWLADYLHMVRLPLSPAQQSWLDSTPGSPQGVIFLCSDAYGYAAWDLAALNSWLESEGGHAEYHAEMHGLWLENTPPEEREEFPFEELSLATFERGSTAPFFKYFAVSPCYFSRDQPSDRLAGQKFDRR